jgi:hypothetical protein
MKLFGLFSPTPSAAPPATPRAVGTQRAVAPTASDGAQPSTFDAGTPDADSSAQAVGKLAAALLGACGRPAAASDARQLLEGDPSLAARLRIWAPRFLSASDANSGPMLQRILRDLAVNGTPSSQLPSAFDDASLQAYAVDAGYRAVKVASEGATLETVDGRSIDLGKPAGAAELLREVGQAINTHRFGVATIVPPPGYESKDTFSVNNAHLAAHLGTLAYEYQATIRSQLELWGFDMSTFTFFRDEKSGIQGFVVADKAGDAFVSFKGTDSLTTAEIDAKFEWTQPSWSQLRMHAGFSGALDSVWPQIQSGIAKIKGAANFKGEVSFVGHSLGGALAEMAALRANTQGLVSADKTSSYTQGSPRWIEQKGVQSYDQMLPRTFRLVNVADAFHDPVSLVPPEFLGYGHVGTAVELRDDGVFVMPPEHHAASSLFGGLIGSIEDRLGFGSQRKPADAVGVKIESLQKDDVGRVMKDMAIQSGSAHRRSRDPLAAGTPTPPAVAEPAQASNDLSWLPRVRDHLTGGYLHKTGSALLSSLATAIAAPPTR